MGLFNALTFGAFDQPESKPFAVESGTQQAFGESFQDLLIAPETDDEGGFLGPGLLEGAFDPRTRDEPFKKAKKRTKRRFTEEQDAGTRALIEDILPAIRESAGARGTGVSTGTQVAGVRAGEAFLEDLSIRRSEALERIDLVRAQAQENLFSQIINASLQQSGTAGVGTPQFGASTIQQLGQLASGVAGAAGAAG